MWQRKYKKVQHNLHKLLDKLPIQALGRFAYLFRHPDRTIRLGTYLTLFGFLLLIGVLVTFYNKDNKVEAGWWNDGWTYRKRIPIANAGTEQTDFQVLVKVDTATPIAALQFELKTFCFLDGNSTVTLFCDFDSGSCDGVAYFEDDEFWDFS